MQNWMTGIDPPRRAVHERMSGVAAKLSYRERHMLKLPKSRVMALLRDSYDLMFLLEEAPPYSPHLRGWVRNTAFLLNIGLGIGAPLVRQFLDIRFYPPGHLLDKATAYLPSHRLWIWYWARAGDPGPEVREAYHRGFAEAKSVLWTAMQEIDRTWAEDPPDDAGA